MGQTLGVKLGLSGFPKPHQSTGRVAFSSEFLLAATGLIDASERRGLTRMGIGSESAGATKGSAPYQSPAVLVVKPG